MLPNLPLKTADRQVFWETLESKGGWKFQFNVFTLHYRIIDPKDIRKAWGFDEKEIRNYYHKFTDRLDP